jgi:hypothetical protein
VDVADIQQTGMIISTAVITTIETTMEVFRAMAVAAAVVVAVAVAAVAAVAVAVLPGIHLRIKTRELRAKRLLSLRHPSRPLVFLRFQQLSLPPQLLNPNLKGMNLKEMTMLNLLKNVISGL